MTATQFTFRRFKDGDYQHRDLRERIFVADKSYKCPTYVHRTPPCQGSCPSGADIRGWLNIVRGIEKPPVGVTWQEYAFQRLAETNPFPSVLGRVCPATCEDGCNRVKVDDRVGINSLEHFLGDYALQNGLKLHPAGLPTGKKVAIIGSGPGGLACAYQLRRQGHAVTIFEARAQLGGMMRYGIPGYRVPRDVLDAEIKRILDLGVEVRTNVKVGKDIPFEQLRAEFNAVFIAVGAQAGTPLDVPGSDAPNCITGITFLEAFNEGRLHVSAQRVLVIGGGDTAMDVAAVARRLGYIDGATDAERPETVLLNQTAQDSAVAARRQGAEVTIVYRRPVEKMPATKMEIKHVLEEGVVISPSLLPVSVVKDASGRATALRVTEVDWTGGKMAVKPGTERDIPCDLIVSAIGQITDFTGMEQLNNGKGVAASDSYYRWPKGEGIFVGGDLLKPHLLTTAIGHASIAAEAIGHYLKTEEQPRQPKVNVHHFNLLEKLREVGREPAPYNHVQAGGTDSATYAVHNFEDRAQSQIVPASDLFLGHFQRKDRNIRDEKPINAGNVLGNFETRLQPLTEEQARAEAARCMSCGVCLECDNCMIYCPQQAVYRVKKTEATMGRYVATDYSKCIGCHICKDVCPTGYIQMGLGE